MTPNQEYLAGYRHATRNVQALRAGLGWAGGKGRIKDTLRFHVKHPNIALLSVFDSGYIDAYLDSVGC